MDIKTLLSKVVDGIKIDFERTDKKVSITISYTKEDKFQELSLIVDAIVLDVLKDGYRISGDNICSEYICGEQKYFRMVILRLKEEVDA